MATRSRDRSPSHHTDSIGTLRLSRWRGEHHYLGRYSVEKLYLFHHYQQQTSKLRVGLVLLLTPFPTFLALLIMDVVPMNSPTAGPSHNVVAFIRSAFSHALMTYVTMLPMKQALSLSDKDYSLSKITAISLRTALTVECVVVPLAFTWRFPLPFRELIGLPIWVTSVVVYNCLFAKRTMKRHWKKHRIQIYAPIVSVQIVLFYAFLGLSIGFAYLDNLPQTLLILTFPFVKIALEHVLWIYARKLDDISTEVTICMLEVSGALYQTVFMQFVTSPVLSILTMITDVVQAVHEVRSYVRLDYLGDGQRTLQTAVKIVDTSVRADAEEHRRSSFPMHNSLAVTASMASLNGQASSEAIKKQDERHQRLSHLVDPTKHNVLVQRARSVYIPSTAVRVATAIRSKKSRRLLDLNHAIRAIDDRSSIGATESTASTGTTGTQSTRMSFMFQDSHVRHRRPGRSLAGSLLKLFTWEDFKIHRRNPKVYIASDERPHKSHAPHPLLRRRSGSRPLNVGCVTIDGVKILRRDQARILEQTLQLLFACETLLFTEYMEVVVPILYALCIGGEWLLPNAQYNLVVMRMSASVVEAQIWNSMLYALLELASMVAMYWVMKRKYGVSAMYQLSFVLERYWMTLQGKLIGAFIVVWNAITVHQGSGASELFS